MSDIGLILNLLLGVLLVAALAVGWRLERRLKALRDSHNSFAEAVGDLDRAAARAEQGLADLRAATDEAAEVLAQRIERAGVMSVKLSGILERGETLAARTPHRPERTEPPRAEPMRSDLMLREAAPRAAPTREPAHAELFRESARAEPARDEPARSEPSRYEPPRHEPVRHETARLEPTRPVYVRPPEPVRPELRRQEPAPADVRMDLIFEDAPRRLAAFADAPLGRASEGSGFAPIPERAAPIAERAPPVRSRARVDEDLFDDSRTLRAVAGGRS